jgi:TolB-like protein
MKKVLITLVSSLAFTLWAAQTVEYAESSYNDADMVNQLVSDLSQQLTVNKNFISIKDPIIAITSFVRLENFKTTTRLSSILSENLINEMQVRGFKVVDFKMMTSINIDKNGDFIFSRNIEKLRKNLNINYALTGTYTVYKDGTVFNARIVNLRTHIVLSTAQVFVPKQTIRRITHDKRKMVNFTDNTVSLSK